MRAIAGSAVRSPTSISQPASVGGVKEPLGSLTTTVSPTTPSGRWAHSVTSPSSWTTTSSTSSEPSQERTV